MGENTDWSWAKKESFCRLFPNMRDLLPHVRDIKSITHGGDINQKLASRHLFFKPGSFFSRRKYESLYVLDGEGKVLGKVGVLTHIKRYWWSTNTFEGKDTLESLVSRLGTDGDNVRYILSVFDGTIIIYEVPRNQTFFEVVMRDIRLSAAKVRILREIQSLP